MDIMGKIKRTLLWHTLRKIKRTFVKREIKKYDGKPLTPLIRHEIQEIIKKNKAIYLHDEKTAKNLADNWQDTLDPPGNIRFIENAIPVVLCANNDFAPYVAVMLQSLLDNSSTERKYHFMIFERDYSSQTREYLTNQVSKFSHCYIDFINTKNALDKIPISLSKSHFTIDIFSRFLIPYWLNKYPKVIYCDSDMFAKTDIAELYNIDIQNYCMGISISNLINEILHSRKYSSLISGAVFSILENWSRYINSGVLVFDTKKFIKKISLQELFRFTIYYTNRYKKTYDDQDVLSLVIKDDYFILPREWNYSWSSCKNEKNLFKQTEANTKIIHFTGKVKPWDNLPEIASNPDALAYKNYAKNIPLFNER